MYIVEWRIELIKKDFAQLFMRAQVSNIFKSHYAMAEKFRGRPLEAIRVSSVEF